MQKHHVWQSIQHDVRTVKRTYPKLRLLTGTYILQKKRAKYNQYAVSACCLLCGVRAETRTHFIAEYPKLGCIRDSFLVDLKVVLNCTNPIGLVDSYLIVSEQCVELLMVVPMMDLGVVCLSTVTWC